MPRFRPSVAATCLAVLLMATLPAPASAARSSELPSTSAAAEPQAGWFIGTIAEWGRSAVAWFQALIAAEHGGIVPQVPEPPPPPPVLTSAP